MKNYLQEINKVIQWEKDGEDFLPLVTVDFGVALCEELARCEPFQRKSIYDDDYARFLLVKKIYDRACNRYPMAMEIAKRKFVLQTLGEAGRMDDCTTHKG